jgi:MFS family permease
MKNDIKGSCISASQGRLSRIMGQTFVSLRNRNFRLYFIGQFVSNTGSWLTNVALVLLVLHITGSGVAVGVMIAIECAPLLLLSAWGGAIADRVDKRRFLLVTQSLAMCQSASLAIIAFMPHPPLAGLYIIAFLGGIVAALDNPLRRAFIREMVPLADLPNAVVLYTVIFNVSRIFGPALAGLLVVAVGYGWCFTLDTASFTAVLFCLYIMRPEELLRNPSQPRARGAVRAGVLYAASMPSLWISFVMLAAVFMLAYNFNTTLPLFVTRSLHSSESVFTLLYSTFSLGAVVTGLIVAHRSMVHLRHIIFGAFAMGASMLLLAFMPGVAMAVPAVFLVGASSIVFMTSSTAIVQVEGKPEMCGRLLALQTVVINGTAVIGGPLLGWLADTLGGRAPLIVGGIASLATAGFGYVANRCFNKTAA